MIWRKAAPSLPPLRARRPTGTPSLGSGQHRGRRTRRDAGTGAGGRAEHPSVWVWLQRAPRRAVKPGLSCLAHGMAQHSTVSSQMHTPGPQPAVGGGGGGGRWLRAPPEPSPTRRCDKRPTEPAANPAMRPGAGMVGRHPARCLPMPTPSSRWDGARWALWGLGTLPVSAPHTHDTPLLSPPGCSHPRRLQDAGEKRFSRR